MIGSLLFVAFALVPTAHALDHQLAIAAERQALAPLGALRPLAAELWLVPHRLDGGPRAVFLPADSEAPTGRWPWSAAVPRLLLHGPTHGLDPSTPHGAPTPWRDLAVDTAEGLAFALVEAWLDPARSDAELDRWIHARAAVLMVEVPEASREIAFRAALADFAAHLVSIANEVYRAADRAAVRGVDACDWLTTGIPLFRLWRQGLEVGAYPGRYPAPREPASVATGPAATTSAATTSESASTEPSSPGPVVGGGTVWRTTRAVLAREDKQALVERWAPGAWSGDPASDFRDLCHRIDGEE